MRNEMDAEIADQRRRNATPVIVGPGMKDIIETVDTWLDRDVADDYKDQPLAQDWARVAKLAEEAGEAAEALHAGPGEPSAQDEARVADITASTGRVISALISCTGQNPRKGVCGTMDEMTGELADVVCTGLFALQHFTKDPKLTADIVEAALVKALNRATAAGAAGS